MPSKGKDTYKVFIKSTGKYFTRSHSKASWTSERWAVGALKDAVRRYGHDDVELHVYPVSEVVVHDGYDYLTEYNDRVREEREAKAEAKRKQEEIWRRQRIQDRVRRAELELAAARKAAEELN